MALESTTRISGLVTTNPTNGDPKSQGDDHLRLLKAVLQTEFNPVTTGATGALTLPGGVLVKWAKTGSINAGASGTATFGAAFPTAMRAIIATPAGGAISSSPAGVGVAASGLDTVIVYNWGASINFSGGVYVIAIGD